jgi:hypothetical protein
MLNPQTQVSTLFNFFYCPRHSRLSRVYIGDVKRDIARDDTHLIYLPWPIETILMEQSILDTNAGKQLF